MTDNNDKKKNDGDKQNKLFIRENTWLVVVIVVLVLAFTVGIVFTLFYNLGSSDKGSVNLALAVQLLCWMSRERLVILA